MRALLRRGVRTTALIVLALQAEHPVRAEEARVTEVWFYNDGHRTSLPVRDESVRGLIRVAETQLQAADSAAMTPISAELMAEVRRKDVAFEILYQAPLEVRIAFNGQVQHITRLLVPLTGMAGGGWNGTSFLYKGDFGPPYLNTGGKAEVVAVLRGLGLSFSLGEYEPRGHPPTAAHGSTPAAD